jgi:hypothetical protein
MKIDDYVRATGNKVCNNNSDTTNIIKKRSPYYTSVGRAHAKSARETGERDGRVTDRRTRARHVHRTKS